MKKPKKPEGGVVGPAGEPQSSPPEHVRPPDGPPLQLAHMLDEPGFYRNLEIEALSASKDPVLLVALLKLHHAGFEQGRKFKGGRKVGTTGPWRKRIAAMLKKDPARKNRDMWDEMKAKPPKGWTFIERSARFQERFEGPKAPQEFKFGTLATYAWEERRKLKANSQGLASP